MKKILLILGIALSTSFFVACETEEKVVDFVFENTQNGAILRQVSVTGLLDLFDVNSGVSVVLEYQDAEGSLASNIQSVDVSLSFVDKNGNGNSQANIPFGQITGWDANGTPFGLPRATFNYQLSGALAAAGLTIDEVGAGDQFVLDFTLNTTSGQKFTNSDANGNIAAVGGWYSSPYQVTSNAVCKLADGFLAGNYAVELIEGTSSYFGDTTNGLGETAVVTATSNTGRTISIGYLEVFGFGPYDFQIDLVCGETVVMGEQLIGLGCSTNLGIAPPDGPNGTFDFTDDSTFTLAITDNPIEDCGVPATQTVYKFTKL
ncbi:MAG: Uncharacterised protein [Flavobacteriaceae bacterium]|jgi:hypothetical protein|nr:hypothetical protein [Flavobacteriaceae bacterium]CAI8194323.1 MAG: Uncharacterised protein [Flavobacteriaceae bacterium]